MDKETRKTVVRHFRGYRSYRGIVERTFSEDVSTDERMQVYELTMDDKETLYIDRLSTAETLYALTYILDSAIEDAVVNTPLPYPRQESIRDALRDILVYGQSIRDVDMAPQTVRKYCDIALEIAGERLKEAGLL